MVKECENVEKLGLSQEGSGDVICRDRNIFLLYIQSPFGFLSKVQTPSLVKK